MASWSAARGKKLNELKRDMPISMVFPDISFEFNQAEIERLTKDFANFPGAVNAALASATERTRAATRREFVAGFRRLITLKPAYISRGIKSRKAKGDAQAVIRIATSNLPLVRYAVSPELPPKLGGVSPKNRPRTSYRLRNAGGSHEKPYSSKAPAGAKLFVQRMASGHIGVFYRTGGPKSAISEDWGPSLQYHAYADGFLPRIEKFARSRFETAFLEEVKKISGVQ